jgi:hypothetical protein
MREAIYENSLAKKLFLSFLLVAIILIMTGSWTVSYGQTTLSVQAKNVSNDSNFASIDFGQLIPDTKFGTPGQYIEIDYESDQSLWFIDIYTDNTNWSGGGYQRGGLITADGKQRAPLLWRVYDNVQTGGVPFNTTDDWAWLKDKGDLDDPDTTQYDESWVSAFSGGYVNICYGGPGYANLSPYPNDPPDLRPGSSPIYVYLGGLFESAGAGEYSTIISFDLYHLAPEDKPVISHKPIEEIGIIGNKIIFNAKITDDKSVENATIHYKIGKSGKWQSKAMALQGSPTEKTAAYILPSQVISQPCQIYYWLEARDGEGNIGSWRDESWPQIIGVTQSITVTVGSKGGKVILPDGNSDDGEVIVDILEGALSKDTKITIEQITDLNGIPGYSVTGDWQPVAIYNFTEEGLKFRKAVTLNLLYFDLDNNGRPEDWKGNEMEFNEGRLACYWWDGITWRPVGGKVDGDRNIVTIKISHFSYYGIFKARPMGISEYRPEERIITPAYSDGKNDVAYFSGLSGQTTTIRIYDITGKKIRTIDGEPYEWDGKDEDGNIVESGVYIYQFKAEVNGKRKLVSGTIAVAK